MFFRSSVSYDFVHANDRPRKITTREDIAIIRTVQKYNFVSAKSIQGKLRLDINLDSIQWQVYLWRFSNL